ncbi:MAG TPA: PIN domain-containing protein [Pseudobacteroides sp.]|uniref:PIN-like domain-containing protein n=1 Tax=Pseudobacteroides sp. TaxID=1968840 RepID=UPI002F9279C1
MSKENYDIFIAEKVFPNVKEAFTTEIKPLQQIKDNCNVVLDTNVLLMPYNIGKTSLEEIEKIYQNIISENRFFLPSQVVREFIRNRPTKLADIYKWLLDKKSKLRSMQEGKYPTLEGIEGYGDMIQIEKEIDDLLQKYKKSIDMVVRHIRDLNWDDRVSIVYKRLFTPSTIYELKYKEEEIANELEKRKIHSIPPGYKDSAKADGGIGDLLVWKSVLEIGKSNNVIFVSGDSKADWWYKRENEAIYPRYELIYEFMNYTSNNTIHIINFSTFLDLFGALDETVKEIKEEEIKAKLSEITVESNLPEGVRRNRLLESDIQKIKSYGISFKNIEELINIYKNSGTETFSTIDLIEDVLSCTYEVGNPVNMMIARILSENRNEFKIKPFLKQNYVDNNGRATSTVLWEFLDN